MTKIPDMHVNLPFLILKIRHL